METKNIDCPMAIKVIAFDLGRVLFNFDYNIAFNKIAEKMDVSAEAVLRALFIENFAEDFEAGKVGPDEFYFRFKRKTGLSLSYKEFIPVWCDIFTLNDGTVSLIKKLKTAYKIFLISNINILHYGFLKSGYPEVFSLFDGQVLSFLSGEVKPSPLIYKELLEKSSCRKESLVYIDDREDLISSARGQGFKSVQFVNTEQCIEGLASLGINTLG